MTLRLFLDPADTLAIRDGRPFNQGDAGRASATSLFPPPPDTLYGAGRVACAYALGFPNAPWPAGQLGSWSTKGPFRVAGPFFIADGAGDLLPIPASVIARMSKADRNSPPEIVAQLPVPNAMVSDLGEMRLLAAPEWDDNLKDEPLAGRWGKAEAVRKLLTGGRIKAVDIGYPHQDGWGVKSRNLYPNNSARLPGWGLDDLAATESRVGIAREIETRQVEEGQLYVSMRRCLRPGVRMFVEIDGVEIDQSGFGRPIPLGGENRFAFTSAERHGLAKNRTKNVDGNYLVCFTTPVAIDAPVPGQKVETLPGRLVTAAVTGVHAQAGRSREHGKPALGASRHVLPAGSVLFMESGGGELPDSLGTETHMGYGRFVTGDWNDG